MKNNFTAIYMRSFLILALIFLKTLNFSFAGGIALVEDYENKLFVFDRGQIKQLEHNQIIQKHTGQNFAAYIDYMNTLKVWQNGKIKTVAESIEHFTATEQLITWEIANYLYVWQDGIKKEICRDAGLVKVKGNLIFFEDKYDNALKIFYNHKIYHFASNYYSLRTKALQMGRKSLAVQDGQDQLFVFVKGQMQMKKFTQDRLLFDAGNIGVLVKNDDTGALELITGRDVINIDYYSPSWFQICYNWIVWQDNSGNFNLWKDQEKKLLTYQKPKVLEYSPEALLFENGSQLYRLQNNHETQVCNYIPEIYTFYNNLFVFKNRQDQVEVVENNHAQIISTMPGVRFELHYDLVVLYEGRKRKVYYDQQLYDVP